MAKKKRTPKGSPSAAEPTSVPAAAAPPPPSGPPPPKVDLYTRLTWVLGSDLRSLALLRIGIGLLVIADLIDRARDLTVHYTDFGLLPRGPLVSRFMNE